jgi:hypothetical protein
LDREKTNRIIEGRLEIKRGNELFFAVDPSAVRIYLTVRIILTPGLEADNAKGGQRRGGAGDGPLFVKENQLLLLLLQITA